MIKQINKPKVINLPPLDELMMDKYIPYINNTDRFLNFIGSRGSGKSVGIAQIIVIRLMMHNYFRGVGIRKIDNKLQESIFKSIKDVIVNWGLTSIFEWTVSPLKISCTENDNYMVFRGLNEPESLKGLSDFSFAFFDEECCETVDDFKTISKCRDKLRQP